MNEIETFYGLVENTLDALRIFQMCREGRLNRVRRRLHERERRLIRSGSVFVFDEEESGIRRWTDGRLWSPSRILGNFLIYRELEKKGHRTSRTSQGLANRATNNLNTNNIFPQKNQKVPKILPKNSLDNNIEFNWNHPRSVAVGIENGERVDDQSEHQMPMQNWNIPHSINPKELNTISGKPQHKEAAEHECTGDLDIQIQHSNIGGNSSNNFKFQQIDPMSGESLRVLKSKKLSNNHKGRYTFKSNGFVKKTISIQLEGHTNHLVAYYSLEDFCRGHLQLEEGGEGREIFDAEDFELNEDATNEGFDDLVVENNGNATSSTTTQVSSSTSYSSTTTAKQPNLPPLPFDPQLMEILRQVSIPVDLMLQQNFRKPAALLASATSTAHNLLDGHPENGEKLITALEYGAINPSDLQPHSHLQQHQSQISHSKPQLQHQSKKPFLLQRENSGFNQGGGIIFSTSTSLKHTKPPFSPESLGKVFYPRPRRHSSFHPPLQNLYPTSSTSVSISNQSQSQETSYNDDSYTISVLDEAAQLSGEALEFLSHYSSDESRPDLDFSMDTITAASLLPSSENDLETELFGTILSDADQLKSNAIRGEDVLFN